MVSLTSLGSCSVIYFEVHRYPIHALRYPLIRREPALVDILSNVQENCVFVSHQFCLGLNWLYPPPTNPSVPIGMMKTVSTDQIQVLVQDVPDSVFFRPQPFVPRHDCLIPVLTAYSALDPIISA